MPPTPRGDDWTTGPAKWAAVLVLGAAGIFGIGWSIFARHPQREALAPLPAAATAGRPAAAPTPTSVDNAAAPPPPDAPREAPTQSLTQIINLNTASEAELELLPGIGPGLAARIAEDRTRRGPFKSVDDLTRVRGIGPETLRKLRPFATVE